MNNYLEYKGYYGSVVYSKTDDLLHGKLVGINDLVSYDGVCLQSLKNCFVESVDDYLDMCLSEGIEAEKTCEHALQKIFAGNTEAPIGVAV